MTGFKKAVIVDDDVKVLMLLEKALKNLGFEVFSSENGTKALELCQKERPLLLITDILQPGIDGIGLCQAVKDDPELSHTKIIMITGVYKESNIRMEMNCKSDAFIEKPINIKDLEKVVLEKVPGL
jgi:CheY-like chemotaxis protein